MGLRSFVALPVEKAGTVLRASVEHNKDTDISHSTFNAAYGISHRQTVFVGLPYRLSSGEGDRMGDVGALYRHIVRQADSAAGTDRLGFQRVTKRWVFEGGMIQDLNNPNHT